MAPKPVYALPIAGGVATRDAHDREVNRCLSAIWDAAVMAQAGTAEQQAMLAELQAVRDGAIAAAETAATQAGAAAAAARFTVAGLANLIDLTDHDLPVGTVIMTRAEGYAYEVVESDPDLTTAGGIGLRVLPGPVGYDVRAFGAKGDGATDDTAAIQMAASRLQSGESLYFSALYDGPPKIDVQYLISAPIIFAANDVKIHAPPRSDYGVAIRTVTPGHDMFKISGYGYGIENIMFWGIPARETGVNSTNRGLVFDRSVLGDQATYCNLDHDVIDCGFFDMGVGIYGRGRNVFVRDCIFSCGRVGIQGVSHFYANGAAEEHFRGWTITNNRFHSVGEASTLYGAPDPTFCIDFPVTTDTFHLQISGNNIDYCGPFYRGSLCQAMITDNIAVGLRGTFVDGGSPAATLNSGNRQSLISGNIVNMVASVAASTTRQADYGINGRGYTNLAITGNALSMCNREAILLDRPGCSVISNQIMNAGAGYSRDAIDYPAISVHGAATLVDGNHVRSSFAPSSYSYALFVTGATQIDGVILGGGNVFDPGRLGDVSSASPSTIGGILTQRGGSTVLFARNSGSKRLARRSQNSGGAYLEFGAIEFIVQSAVAGGEKADALLRATRNGVLLDNIRAHWGGGVQLPPLAAAPDSPPPGLLAMADGTGWNPGSGAGLYRWSGSAWVFVG
ncbi:hypothetical protein ACEYYA_00970 [Paracoccus sp. p3-h83]|uniref:hypothetical protein n=1 Tax=Paracoccus sp. p3-h83 TaxID=3342805 RepID=UPI0035B8239B